MNPQIALFDVLQENVNTRDVAIAVIKYYNDIACDMKLCDEWAEPSAEQVRSYVEGGEMQAEAAAFFEEMFDVFKRDVIREITQARLRVAKIEFDARPEAPRGTVESFTVSVD